MHNFRVAYANVRKTLSFVNFKAPNKPNLYIVYILRYTTYYKKSKLPRMYLITKYMIRLFEKQVYDF